ncbi:hypothetical protein DYB32_009650 [Aphanomyces invadans]|uniref:Cytochrome P450 n=1 Tax=Aphanomyces invadans TaxID=157072 RepID=A0A418AHX1_9STRA|nr:hypothetical protein DYB32_009650 [Aphanomyces invadans]
MLASLLRLQSRPVEVSTTAAIATASGVVLGTLVLRYLWRVHHLNKLPSPQQSSFIFGHLFDTLGSVGQWKTTGNYPEPFLSWVKAYGGAIHLRELLTHVVLLTDPKAVQHVLVTNGANYPRNPTLQAFFSVLFHELTLEIIGLSAFGFSFDSRPEVHNAYHQFTLKLSPALLIGVLTIPGFLRLPLAQFRRRRAAQRVLKKIMIDVIDRKLQSPAKAPDARTDLLDLFLPQATTQEALVHTMTFMSAGHRTSASSLGWIIACLATRPHAVAAIRSEYHHAVAKHGSLGSWEAVSALKYTAAFVMETLRVHTIAHMLIRQVCQKDDSIPLANGTSVFVPAVGHLRNLTSCVHISEPNCSFQGTTIEINLAAMNRNSKYWTNPDSFVPERFLEDTPEWNADLQLRDGKSHTFYSLTFSAGSKNCIGMRFALAEIRVVVATLVAAFDFVLTPHADLRPRHNGVTLQPTKLEMSLRRVQC